MSEIEILKARIEVLEVILARTFNLTVNPDDAKKFMAVLEQQTEYPAEAVQPVLEKLRQTAAV